MNFSSRWEGRKTRSSVGALTAFERQSSTFPRQKKKKKKSFGEGEVFWQGLLSTCDCHYCLDASAWFLQHVNVFTGRHRVYASCTGSEIIDQSAGESQDRTVCSGFGIYIADEATLGDTPCKIHHLWEIPSQVDAVALHTSLSVHNYHTLKGLFVFASRCNHVAWVGSLLRLCRSNFHCKQEMSGCTGLCASENRQSGADMLVLGSSYVSLLAIKSIPLTVERWQLPGGVHVCCFVMKAFLFSGLDHSPPDSRWGNCWD